MIEDLAPWITPALLVGLFAWLRADIRRVEDRLRADMSDMRSELSGRIDGLEGRLDGLDERLRAVEAGLAELRGQLSFIQDYILRRNAPPDEQAPAE